MRTLLTLMVLIVLVGGGYYWYSQNMAVTPTTTETPFGSGNTNTVPANTNTGSANTDTSNDTTIGIDGSVSVGAVKEFTITNAGMTFTTKTMTVKKGDRVKVTYKNAGGTHDLRIDGYNVGTKVISSGEDSFEFVADEAGTFEYYCSVGNHRAMGMVGTLTVTN